MNDVLDNATSQVTKWPWISITKSRWRYANDDKKEVGNRQILKRKGSILLHVFWMYSLEVLRPFLASHVDIRIKSSSRKYDLRSTQHESCQYEYNRWWCIYAHTIQRIYFWSKKISFLVPNWCSLEFIYRY